MRYYYSLVIEILLLISCAYHETNLKIDTNKEPHILFTKLPSRLTNILLTNKETNTKNLNSFKYRNLYTGVEVGTYSNIAAYETIVQEYYMFRLLSIQLNGFTSILEAAKNNSLNYYGTPDQYRPTSSSYIDGIEPHWNYIRRSFGITTASQFKLISPLKFSLDKESIFNKEIEEVYDISKEISTKKGDASKEIKIAQFLEGRS